MHIDTDYGFNVPLKQFLNTLFDSNNDKTLTNAT